MKIINSILLHLQYSKPLVLVSNTIKIILICTCDVLNKLYDPFEDFTRFLDVKYSELLNIKAQKFETSLFQNFKLFNVVWNYRKPADGSIDTGDQALHHGIATAALALKYAVTNDPDILIALRNSIIGLNAHQAIHGEKTPRLIRGFRLMTETEVALYPVHTSWINGDQKFFSTSNNLIIEDSVSNDTATGHLLGIYFAWLYGDDDIKYRCISIIEGLVDELLENNNSFINVDGSYTQYGKLAPGVLADPLCASLCLAIYKVGFVISGYKPYHERYVSLKKEYGLLAKYAKVKLWWFGNDEDAHRAAIHLSILCDLDEDNAMYKKGLQRVWYMSKKSMNVWVAFLNARHNTLSENEINRCKDILKEFTFEDKQFDVQKLNSSSYSNLLIKWGNNIRSKQPLPKWRIGAQDFFWQRNLNSVDNWQGNVNPTQSFQGVDFLICYWLGRKLNIIAEKE